MSTESYCENGECRVVMFRIDTIEGTDLLDDKNCPTCGRFGRIKDDPKAE